VLLLFFEHWSTNRSQFPMLAPKGNFPSLLKPKTKEWAHMVDTNQEITNFRELVPNMAKEVGNSRSLNQP